MKEEMVSIIMPTYNRARVITRTIKSVIRQTYKNWELLIIDDGSTDDTEQVVAAINNSRIEYIKLPINKGACHARNQGLARAKGEYIAFLDSDNVWMKNYLEERIKVLKAGGKSVGGVFGYFEQIRIDKTRSIIPAQEFGQKIANCKSNNVLIRQMLFDNVIDTNTVVLKKCCADKIDGFDERIMRMQDWEYFFRILYFSGYRMVFQENCLVKNYIQKDSITSKKKYKDFWDTRILFLEKYKEILMEYGCLHDVVFYLCNQRYIQMDEDIVARLLNVVNDEGLEKLIMKWRLTHIEKLQLLEGYMDLHMRENKIIKVQNQWLSLKRKKIELGVFLESQGYKKIAIYGYGHLGKSLYEELISDESSCEVVCVIDSKLKDDHRGEVSILHPKELIYDMDAVIVTAVANYEDVKRKYEKEVPFISLETIIEQANLIV